MPFIEGIGRPHIEPKTPFLDCFGCLFVGQVMSQRILYVSDKIRLFQTHQKAFGKHGGRSDTRTIRKQRLFSEAVTRSQLDKLLLYLVAGCTRNTAVALVEQIEVITLVTLTKDDIPLIQFNLFHIHDDTLNIGWRYPLKNPHLEQLAHPVIRDIRFRFGHFFGRNIVLGQQLTKHSVVHANQLRTCSGHHGKFPGNLVRKREPGRITAGSDRIDLLLSRKQSNPSRQQIDGLIVGIPGLKKVFPFLHLFEPHRLHQTAQRLITQRIERHQFPQHFQTFMFWRNRHTTNPLRSNPTQKFFPDNKIQ